MPKADPQQMDPPMCRVWIEFDKPESEEHAQRIVESANKMMRKLGMEHDVFGWLPDKRMFTHEYPDNAGFLYLTDRGEWFNLEYLAR